MRCPFWAVILYRQVKPSFGEAAGIFRRDDILPASNVKLLLQPIKSKIDWSYEKAFSCSYVFHWNLPSSSSITNDTMQESCKLRAVLLDQRLEGERGHQQREFMRPKFSSPVFRVNYDSGC